MNKTVNGHNMLWIDGDRVGLKVIDIMKEMYGERLVYPTEDLTPFMIPEYYYVIFTIDGEELSIECQFGDYVLDSIQSTTDSYVAEIENELIKRF